MQRCVAVKYIEVIGCGCVCVCVSAVPLGIIGLFFKSLYLETENNLR